MRPGVKGLLCLHTQKTAAERAVLRNCKHTKCQFSQIFVNQTKTTEKQLKCTTLKRTIICHHDDYSSFLEDEWSISSDLKHKRVRPNPSGSFWVTEAKTGKDAAGLGLCSPTALWEVTSVWRDPIQAGDGQGGRQIPHSQVTALRLCSSCHPRSSIEPRTLQLWTQLKNFPTKRQVNSRNKLLLPSCTIISTCFTIQKNNRIQESK